MAPLGNRKTGRSRNTDWLVIFDFAMGKLFKWWVFNGKTRSVLYLTVGIVEDGTSGAVNAGRERVPACGRSLRRGWRRFAKRIDRKPIHPGAACGL
jgi:hypothetical protein